MKGYLCINIAVLAVGITLKLENEIIRVQVSAQSSQYTDRDHTTGGKKMTHNI